MQSIEIKTTLDAIKKKMPKNTDSRRDIKILYDYSSMIREGIKHEDIRKESLEYGKHLCSYLEKNVPKRREDINITRALYNLHKDVLQSMARYNFDSYCLYIEWDREPEKKFYAPRRKQLKPLADTMEKLYYGELDLLCISMPPGVGKSTLAIFFLTWVGGNDPEGAMLTGSHNSGFVRGVYNEIIKIVSNKESEYLFNDIFPESPLVNTNAQDLKIDLGTEKRFSTFQFTSVGSGNAGKFRATKLLYCDDLVSGIEEAMSKERMDKLWELYTTDLMQRKLGLCAELVIATRWSLYDPIGRLEEMYGDYERAEFIRLPALDENDESLFDYPYHLGYTTEALHKQRDIMEEASWKALYMNEPIEREGQLYSANELRRFFELPDREPDAILSVCDTKDKGSDFEVMPIGYMYGNDVYIADVCCDDGKPEVVEEKLVELLLNHKVQISKFESNSAGGRIAEKVQNEVKTRGGITKITTEYTTANKETKIIVNSPWIKEHCLFLDDSVIKEKNMKEYRKFMNFLTTYTLKGKNKHDDVPDAMAMLSIFVQNLVFRNVQVFTRPF